MSSARAGGHLPDVAVVIPLYNGAPWIEATLKSVLEQTHPPCEVVVVDDGSSDDSPQIVSTFPGVRLCRGEGGGSGEGAGPPRRFGQFQTTAPLVAFLDQDDLWHPEHLRLLAAALMLDVDAPAAVSEVRNFKDGSKPDFDAPVVEVEPVDPWDNFLQTVTLTPSAVLVRRSELERVGGWTNEHSPSDFFMWLRLSERSPLLLNRCASAARRLHEEGHFKRLLTEQTMGYLSRRTRAAVAATFHREAARPEEAPALVGKRDLARGLEGIVTGLAQRDHNLIIAAAGAMERGSVGESEECIEEAVLRLLSFATRLANSPGELEAQQALLISSWPRRAAQTGQVLRRHLLPSVSVRSIARVVSKRPFSRLWWQLLCEVSAQRVGRLFEQAMARSRRKAVTPHLFP